MNSTNQKQHALVPPHSSAGINLGLLLGGLMVIGLLLKNSVLAAEADADKVVSSGAATFAVETVADGYTVPWAMAFLSDSEAVVGEREAGQLSRLNVVTGEKTIISGLPDMLRSKKISAGLHDIKLDENFAENGWLYLAYTVGTEQANGLVVDRVTLVENSVTEAKRLFAAQPLLDSKWHFGGRLVLHDGYLYISVGDGYKHADSAQDLGTHLGKVMRVRQDGSVPEDNPFISTEGALPEIWSYGIRNPQGMALSPFTEEVWISEHGPQGGDEINIVRAGKNYGWPVITYGEEYGGGAIGEGITHQAGLEQPVYYYRPSIAPSGLSFYSGGKFPGWRLSLFTGALALTHINRLVLHKDQVIHEERLLDEGDMRVRFVQEGKDGLLYFGADDGKIRRLVPAEKPAKTETE
ncbi:MAG: PQQ-dependent sugar dehydrogenase [Pseudomonadota bacterium]